MSSAVSVIIPTYNRAQLLPRALESALAQTLAADEIVVVDDGSGDNTAEVMAPYADRGVRYIRKPNGGASSARNMGLQLASGEFVAFLDSDDEWRPQKLARQMEFFKDNPGVGLCFTDAVLTGSGKVVAESMNWMPRRQMFGKSLGIARGWSGVIPAARFRQAQIQINLVNPSQVMVRKSVFDRCGSFNSAFDPVEDYEMWLRISRCCDACYIDEPLAFIHSHAEALTRRPELQVKFRRQTMAAYMSEAAAEQDPQMRQLLQRRLHDWWESEIDIQVSAKDPSVARQVIREARTAGYRPDGQTSKVVRVACLLGPGAAMAVARLRGMLGRA